MVRGALQGGIMCGFVVVGAIFLAASDGKSKEGEKERSEPSRKLVGVKEGVKYVALVGIVTYRSDVKSISRASVNVVFSMSAVRDARDKVFDVVIHDWESVGVREDMGGRRLEGRSKGPTRTYRARVTKDNDDQIRFEIDGEAEYGSDLEKGVVEVLFNSVLPSVWVELPESMPNKVGFQWNVDVAGRKPEQGRRFFTNKPKVTEWEIVHVVQGDKGRALVSCAGARRLVRSEERPVYPGRIGSGAFAERLREVKYDTKSRSVVFATNRRVYSSGRDPDSGLLIRQEVINVVVMAVDDEVKVKDR